jgi:ABC-type dipeptide/oligopeptide/nickel transport system permease component
MWGEIAYSGGRCRPDDERCQHSKEGSAMQGYIIRRVLYAIVSLTLLSITIFCLVRITGDPAVLMAEPGAKEEDLQAIRREFGLDKPLVVQYFLFVKSIMRGDFGKSIYYRIPAFDLYVQRLPASLLLAAGRHSGRDLLGGAHQHLV